MAASNARISRVSSSWRVRVFGHPPKFFADRDHGGKLKALEKAKKWRDARWNGKDRSRKLTDAERKAIRKSKAHYADVAEKYGISPNYVHQIRREADE